jgi:hypothetical protein
MSNLANWQRCNPEKVDFMSIWFFQLSKDESAESEGPTMIWRNK